jgi:hypothetical protein
VTVLTMEPAIQAMESVNATKVLLVITALKDSLYMELVMTKINVNVKKDGQV